MKKAELSLSLQVKDDLYMFQMTHRHKESYSFYSCIKPKYYCFPYFPSQILIFRLNSALPRIGNLVCRCSSSD